MNDTLNYSLLFNSSDGQAILDDLVDKFYRPTLKQDNVHDTYFRLGAHDLMCYILARVETNKTYLTNIQQETN